MKESDIGDTEEELLINISTNWTGHQKLLLHATNILYNVSKTLNTPKLGRFSNLILGLILVVDMSHGSNPLSKLILNLILILILNLIFNWILNWTLVFPRRTELYAFYPRKTWKSENTEKATVRFAGLVIPHYQFNIIIVFVFGCSLTDRANLVFH